MATRKRAKKKQSTRKSSKRAAGKSAKRKSAKRKSAPRKSTTRKSTRKAAKRTLIAPRGDKRYVRRTKQGRFKESDDVGASLSADRRKRAKHQAPKGQGDRGD